MEDFNAYFEGKCVMLQQEQARDGFIYFIKSEIMLESGG